MANHPATSEKMLNVKVPEDLKQSFTLAVGAQDQTVSQVIRDFMRKYVAQHGQGKLL